MLQLRTVAITHRIYPGNGDPLTPAELKHLIGEPLIATGTNWRGKSRSEWQGDTKAKEELDLFEFLAAHGGLIVANYEGLTAYQRAVGRVVPTATREPEIWNRLRVLRLVFVNWVNAQAAGIDDLQVLPGRTLVDVSERAGDRVLKLLGTKLV